MNTNMVWFQGVVEDRNDPLQLGRVKIRCVGYHTDDKTELPTEDLPWATPVQPITSAAMSGIGTTPVGPVEGSWVVGFFRDGTQTQLPVFFGTLGGIQSQPARDGRGFKDPNGNYPLTEGPNAVGNADTNSLARGAGGVPLETRIENLDAMLSADPDTPFLFNPVDENAPRYAAQYPFNHVKFTESGHVEEFDDTPGAERMHRYHRSGTFEEIGPDGERTLKVVNKNYTVVMGENDLHVVGPCNVQLDGATSVILAQGAKITSLKDFELTVIGDFKVNALGKATMNGLQTDIRGFPINLNGPPDPDDIPV
jgi:hypothetical protein